MNKDELKAKLRTIGLTTHQAAVFTTLLEGYITHLQISEHTGINRTTVYRVVDELEQKGIAQGSTSDEGRHIATPDLAALEMLVTSDEVALKEKQEALRGLLLFAPTLRPDNDTAFEVRTFYGKSGLKQMLWNELKAKQEIVLFSYHKSINGVAGKGFADKFRAEVINRNIHQRALCNNPELTILDSDFTDEYRKFYDERFIDPSVLPINQEMTIQDNTVSIYNWDEDSRVGTEIHNPQYAEFMRQVFEHFWEATPKN